MDEVETTAELGREVASLRVANLFVTERNAELAEANEFLRRAYSEQFAEIVAMRAQLGWG